MKRLMIADSSAVFVSALQSALGAQYEIFTCFDGENAEKLLPKIQPDVLIINLMLPYRDGLTILQQAQRLPPVVLALVPYLNPYIQHSIAQLGIDYTMICPTVKALCLQLHNLMADYTAQPESKEPAAVTAHHLRILGIGSRRDGYRYLCAAVPLYAQDPSQLITKELYPAVVHRCGCKDVSQVERCIRSAICTAWQHMDRAIWRKYFPPGPRGQIPCPTNKEFISRIAEFLELP